MNLTSLKKSKKYLLAVLVAVIVVFLGMYLTRNKNSFDKSLLLELQSGQIVLYGEGAHGDKKVLEKEFKIWKEYYDKYNMRDLFVEEPYFTAEYLNLWMKSDNDEILDQIFLDLEGTQGATEHSKNFYKKIKEQCPKTVFHGTDVGHYYWSIGSRFLDYLKSTGQESSEIYNRTRDAIDQGIYYYTSKDSEEHNAMYRENKMVENFILEYSKLEGKNIMGIYGGAHIKLGSKNWTKEVDNMATQLQKVYKDKLHCLYIKK